MKHNQIKEFLLLRIEHSYIKDLYYNDKVEYNYMRDFYYNDENEIYIYNRTLFLFIFVLFIFFNTRH